MPATSLITARKPHTCGNHPCLGNIVPGDLYIRHVAFPGDDGHEEGTRPLVMKQCLTCANRNGDWIRQHYGIPAWAGMRVTVDGKPGNIVGFTDGLQVLLDTGKVAPAHPRWRVVYYTPQGTVAVGIETANHV